MLYSIREIEKCRIVGVSYLLFNHKPCIMSIQPNVMVIRHQSLTHMPTQ